MSPSPAPTIAFLKLMCKDDSSLAANLLPICTPCAPSTIAASICLPVAIPPAAITGIFTASQTNGTNTIVVVSSLPLWPPASKPSATTASQPASSAFFANLLLLTTCTTVILCCFNRFVHIDGLPADEKTTGTSSSIIICICFSTPEYNNGTFTPKGLRVAALDF